MLTHSSKQETEKILQKIAIRHSKFENFFESCLASSEEVGFPIILIT